MKRCTPLIRIDGTLNQHKYISILDDYLLLFADTYHSETTDFIFQQDGCGPHKTKAVRTFLEAKQISVLPWHAQSPDMNPIENAWAMLKRNLPEQNRYPTSKDSLFERLSEVRNSILNSYFETLIASMTSRVKALEKAKGLSTKY